MHRCTSPCLDIDSFCLQLAGAAGCGSGAWRHYLLRQPFWGPAGVSDEAGGGAESKLIADGYWTTMQLETCCSQRMFPAY